MLTGSDFHAASRCRQDVLARTWAVDFYDDERRVPLSTHDQLCQDYSRSVLHVSSRSCAPHSAPPDQIKKHNKDSVKHRYTLFLIPRISTLVSRILEEEGVLGDVTVSSYNLQFIPIAEDVVSLEYENAVKELWVVRRYLCPLLRDPAILCIGW